MRRLLAAGVLPLVLVLASCSTTRSPDQPVGNGTEIPTPPTGTAPSSAGTSPSPAGAPMIGTLPKVEKPARGANRPYVVLGKRYVPITGDQPLRERGIGSWYGRQFHGKKTSIGETFNMYAVSAAHKTMELPSYAKVTNLENGKSIILRVNDRGPFFGDRIIDLSYEAARRLGYAEKGTARVEVERITMAEIASGSWRSGALASGTLQASTETAQNVPSQSIQLDRRTRSWSVQIGAFSSADNARAWSAHAEALLSSYGYQRSYATRIVKSSDGLYRVMAGQYQGHDGAAQASAEISQIIGSRAFPSQR